jgi:hypothetical protein
VTNIRHLEFYIWIKPLGTPARVIAFVLGGFLSLLQTIAFATTYYVDARAGHNHNNGTAIGTPFRTIQRAVSATKSGDTVFVRDGVYREQWPGAYIVNIDHSGRPDAWIVYEAYPGEHPKLRYKNSWAAINITADYIAINGFEIEGNAKSVTYAYAQSQDQNLDNPLTSGDGIDIGPGTKGYVNHVIIENNNIHDVSGGGIVAVTTDYITIWNNIVYNTSWWSPYGNSGISIYESQNTDGYTGYKNFILNNVTYHDQEYFPCACVNFQYITDGNGIIVDDNLNTYGNNIPYNARTLVGYNLSYKNGGAGVQAFSSQHVDVINNTAYLNEKTPNLDQGQIFASEADDVNMINNILWASRGKIVITSDGNGSSVFEDYNLFWGVQPMVEPFATNSNDLVDDAQFVDRWHANFHLDGNSLAVGSGNLGFVQNAFSNMEAALKSEKLSSNVSGILSTLAAEEPIEKVDRGAL